MTAVVTPPAVSVKMPSVFGEFLNAGDDFDVGDVLSPAAGFGDHLGGCGAVRGVADGERAGDGVGALRLDVVPAFV